MAHKPSKLLPQDQIVDLTVTNDFSCYVSDLIASQYSIQIHRRTDDSIVWQSGDITPTVPTDSGDRLIAPVSATGMLSTDIELYWVMNYYDGTDWYASLPVFFENITTPTMSIVPAIPNPVTSQRHEIITILTQAQDIKPKYWYYRYFDINMNEILRTEDSISFTMSHEIDGLSSGETYYHIPYLVYQYDTVYEGAKNTINVLFDIPDILMTPIATQVEENNSVNLNIGELYQKNGIVESGTESYGSFMYPGNIGYVLSGSIDILKYTELNIPIGGQTSFVRSFNSDLYDGGLVNEVFLKFGRWKKTSSGETITVGYARKLASFYREIDGEKIYSTTFYPLSTMYYVFALEGKVVTVDEYSESGGVFTLVDSISIT